jgi:hypothetical protein
MRISIQNNEEPENQNEEFTLRTTSFSLLHPEQVPEPGRKKT